MYHGNWFNYWTNKSVKGGKEMWVDTHFDEIPVLLKQVHFQISHSTICSELAFEELTLDVYYKEGKEKSVVYEDGQDGYDYKKGRFCHFIRLEGKKK
jgi:alpha-glucosidase